MNKLTVGWSTRAGSGKQEGESEDFLWRYEAPDTVVAVVGDFARAAGSVPLAQRAPEQLGTIAERLREARVAPAEWPRALLYEYGNFLFATNHHDRTPRPCAAVALCIHGEHLVAAQQGDVRLAVWRSGQLYFPLGGRWQQVVPDPGMREAPLDGPPLALGTGTITSPLAIPVWTTRLQDGDLVLCFSDGMEDQFPPARMAEILRTYDPAEPQPVARALLEAAFAAHPSDDKTLFLAHVRLTAQPDPVAEQIGQLRTTVEGQVAQLRTAMEGQLGQMRTTVDSLTPQKQFSAFREQVDAQIRRMGEDAAGTRQTASQANSEVQSLSGRIDKVEATINTAGNESSRATTLEQHTPELLRRLAQAETQISGLSPQRTDSTAGSATAEVEKLRQDLQALTERVDAWKEREQADPSATAPETPVRLGNTPAPVADRSSQGGKKHKGKGGGPRDADRAKELADASPSAKAAADDDAPGWHFSWPKAALLAAVLIPSLLLAFTASQLFQAANLLREMRAAPADSMETVLSGVLGDTVTTRRKATVSPGAVPTVRAGSMERTGRKANDDRAVPPDR